MCSSDLAQAVARVGGDPKKCRCVDAVGEAQTRLTDVIIALDEMANGITFNSSFYDTAEWTSEASRIIQGGFYLSKQKKLYNVIKELQEGCNLRFRYEFNSSLLRTIRIDDDSREPIHYIQKEEIKENGTLRITTDRETPHINLYIDLATMRTRLSEASEAARVLSVQYVNNVVIDTIVCLDNCEVIGAYLAQELTAAGIRSMNQHQTMYVVSPEFNTNGQMVFREGNQSTI